MNMRCLYFDKQPLPSPDWACQPVWVPHGDGTAHWEVLVDEGTWARREISAQDLPTVTDVAVSNPKWLRPDKTPRHVFGPWGGDRDPRKPIEPPTLPMEVLK
ncbi:MAG: hypothetical protein A2Y72_03270 [Chloroflexi bacterium RBG_13_53_26]|nr:MAG: hypothetical protein A2Y72_03270 [Chloroflexi bacterium RBG_13_53_26]